MFITPFVTIELVTTRIQYRQIGKSTLITAYHHAGQGEEEGGEVSPPHSSTGQVVRG